MSSSIEDMQSPLKNLPKRRRNQRRWSIAVGAFWSDLSVFRDFMVLNYHEARGVTRCKDSDRVLSTTSSTFTDSRTTSTTSPVVVSRGYKDAITGHPLVTILVAVGFGAACAWAHVYRSKQTGLLIATIAERDRSEYNAVLVKVCIAVAVGAISNVAMLSLGSYLCDNRLRQFLCDSIIGRHYLCRTDAHAAHYALLHVDRDMHDPHVRISSDIALMCTKLKLVVFGAPMFPGVLLSMASLVYFTYALVTASSWFPPVATLVPFALVAVLAFLTSKIAKRELTGLAAANSQYQIQHNHVAENSESIAFYRSEGTERDTLKTTMQVVCEASNRSALASIPLNIVTMLFYWGTSLVSVVIPGLGWMWLHDDSFTNYVTLNNVNSLLSQLFYTLAMLPVLAFECAELSALLSRVAGLITALDRYSNSTSHTGYDALVASGQSGSRGVFAARHVCPGSGLEVRNMSLLHPGDEDKKVLIKCVSFEVGTPNSHSVLLMGRSGCGKSTLLRAIGGLLPETLAPSGDPIDSWVSAPPAGCAPGHMMFLPQRPLLLPLGATVLDQVCYPSVPSQSDAPFVFAMLETLELGHLANSLDVQRKWEWRSVLSTGEQQRVAICRALFHRPHILVMDESTSALDEETEYLALSLLTGRVGIESFEGRLASPIHLLSVAHRSTVKPFHTTTLHIGRDGTVTTEIGEVD